MDKNQLKMNSSQSELIVIGSKHQLETYALNSLKVDDTVIMAKSAIKFLGTYLDEFLNMKTRITNRTKNAFYNLHLIKTSEDVLLRTQQKCSYVHWYSHNWTTLTQFSWIYQRLHLGPITMCRDMPQG